MKGDAGFPVRVRFTKRGKVRFVSHRDVARAFERAFRIEALPLAFTLGFSPRPKVSFGLALGVGHESVAEYLDVELAEPMVIDDLPRRLSDALPEGIDVTGVAALRDRAPSLQEAVGAVEVRLTLADIRADELARTVESAIAADTLPVETTRKGRAVVEDLRPAIRRIAVATDDTGHPVVEADTSTSPRGIRPADLLLVLRELAGTPAADGEDRVLRTHQWIERDGARLEPLEADRAALPTRIDDKGLTDDRRDHSGGDHLHPGSAGDLSTGDLSTGDLSTGDLSTGDLSTDAPGVGDVAERRIA